MADSVQKNKQPAGLATTPSKANIAGAPRLSCVKKLKNVIRRETTVFI
jgi:hypothetical protein